MEKVLEIKDLNVSFDTHAGEIQAVRGISLDLKKGETLAIVGESGSGKSVASKSLMRLIPTPAGRIKKGAILFQGKDLVNLTEKQMQRIRGSEISMIFQDPMTSLNPTMTIGKQIMESLQKHKKLPKPRAKEKAIELLKLVGIHQPEKRFTQYPHQFSGGMRQRVVIAIALACEPKVLIADEPTTALDVTIQAQILELLKDIQAKMQMSIIFITHDLGVVANMADRVAVMYAGKIVEIGKVNEIFLQPQHPYTMGLLGAMPKLDNNSEELISIPGTPPNLLEPPKGDAFATRNEHALKIDFELQPPMFQISDTHYAATWLLHENAEEIRPKIRKAILSPLPIIQEQTTTAGKNKEKLIEIKDLQVHFKLKNELIKAVDNISFTIFKGETFGIVGESGSGKSTLGKAIIRLNEISSGEVLYNGKNINTYQSQQEQLFFSRQMQMIFQDPYSSLNPRMTVADIIAEGLDIHGLVKSKDERMKTVHEMLETVGLNREHANRYPHEFSGGQRQRIGIARALAVDPAFIIADEPISALDVSIQAQVINLLRKLQREKDLTYMFITHDLSMAKYISDRIGVMCKGRLVELAESEQLFKNPLHPYTKALLSAIPTNSPDIKQGERTLFKEEEYNLALDNRVLREISEGHWVVCTEEEYQHYQNVYQC